MNPKNEFYIICISDCNSLVNGGDCIKKGDKFRINTYEYNYSENYMRLIVGNEIIGFYLQSNFMKLSEYRNLKLDELLK